MESSRSSKRMKSEELHFDDDYWTSDNGGTSSKAGRASTSLSNNTSGNDRRKYDNNKDLNGEAKMDVVSGKNAETHVPVSSDDGLLSSEKRDDKDSVRKRKAKEHHSSQIHTEPISSSGRRHLDSGDFMEEMSESDRRKEKKARISKSGGKDTSGSKASVGTDRKGRSTKDQQNGQYLSNTQAADYLKSDMGSLNPSVAANSSSSKVSGSHKNKTNGQEVKGSPVESVSSSPLRYSNADKVTPTKNKLVGKDDFHDSGSLAAVSPRQLSGGEDEGGNDRRAMQNPSEQSKVEEKTNTDQSQKKKSGKGLSSHSKDKARASGSDLDKIRIKASDSSRDSLDHEHLHEEKSKSRRNKSDDKSGIPIKGEKFIGKKDTVVGMSSESSKGQSQKKFGHDGQDVIKSQHDNEKLPKKSNQAEANGSGKSHALPPLARVSTETVSGSQKENGVKILSVDALDNGDALKAPNQRKKAENSNGQPIRHPTPNSHRARDVEAPSPVRRDSSSHAANSALKEAKDLKHLADRLKNSGSTDSNGFYFQAALKFLHGASLLESGSSEATKQNELMHSVHIYSSTAKLCE
ncbi:hypothetical protein DH2020_007293 [Rehmannia glutinosa]|uniref:CWZF3/5/7 THD domain-containing protein n=1 Tax=Rehmannia glutinosa TaxID=99300 RepID=A0ABR0TXN5_REHGL